MVQVRCKVAVPCCPLHMAHACYLELQCPAQCFSLRCQSNGVLGHSHFPGGTLKGAKLKVSACSILWASETRLSRKKKKLDFLITQVLFWFPGRSETHWSSLYNSSLPSWVNSSVPDTCITGFQFISFQQPLANISSPFLFLLLAFTLSAKSLLVGLQLALWHLPLLISLCCCSCYPWGLNEEQVDVIRSLSGKRMGREPITNQGII